MLDSRASEWVASMSCVAIRGDAAHCCAYILCPPLTVTSAAPMKSAGLKYLFSQAKRAGLDLAPLGAKMMEELMSKFAGGNLPPPAPLEAD